ncbi:2-oxoglutarate and iron-dependent oxygenase domain-containing protein [Streptomyces sp. NPDC086554]|uniref:isopenicillin N synthase family dioxygenase n=1 Tax=Streptomyces sp. NPDC086554 TaxID=3154864 RepID=UPI0034318A56
MTTSSGEPARDEPRIPTIDLRPWLTGDPAARAAVARTVDRALQTAGFLLVTGHGVDPSLCTRIRAAARAFFVLPASAKKPYAAKVGGRGWLGPGAEANAYSEGTETPPDLKESLTFATDRPFDDPAINAEWYEPNVWPAEAGELKTLCADYLARMEELTNRLLTLLGEALGEEPDFFTRHMSHPTYGFNINWYPGTHVVGTVTILDRQSGNGGLQVFTDEGGWEDAPYDPDAFTINIGDLMARWTGDRWRSGRHRVLPPPADAPAGEAGLDHGGLITGCRRVLITRFRGTSPAARASGPGSTSTSPSGARRARRRGTRSGCASRPGSRGAARRRR